LRRAGVMATGPERTDAKKSRARIGAARAQVKSVGQVPPAPESGVQAEPDTSASQPAPTKAWVTDRLAVA
jgi:hypothetical protein